MGSPIELLAQTSRKNTGTESGTLPVVWRNGRPVNERNRLQESMRIVDSYEALGNTMQDPSVDVAFYEAPEVEHLDGFDLLSRIFCKDSAGALTFYGGDLAKYFQRDFPEEYIEQWVGIHYWYLPRQSKERKVIAAMNALGFVENDIREIMRAFPGYELHVMYPSEQVGAFSLNSWHQDGVEGPDDTVINSDAIHVVRTYYQSSTRYRDSRGARISLEKGSVAAHRDTTIHKVPTGRRFAMILRLRRIRD
jgi:hypothetical protein